MGKLRPPRRIAALLLGLGAGACASAPQGAPADIAAPSPPADPVYQTDDILGAPPGALDALLGAPALVRREGKGEYRRYQLRECALIVLLYPDEVGAVRAAHLDASALASGAAKPDLEACLAAG